MKNSKKSQKIKGLEKQKVNADKIKGGGVGPDPIVLTKDLVSNREPMEEKSKGTILDNKTFLKKPRANKNRAF